MKIKSNLFNHSLKNGATVRIWLVDSYGLKSSIDLIYRGRDALAFWGNSLQSGGLMHFSHQEIELIN